MRHLTCTTRRPRRGANMHLDGAWHGCRFRPCILLLRFSKRSENYHRISFYPSASIVRQIGFVVALGAVPILLEWIMQMQAKKQLLFSSCSVSPHQWLLVISTEPLLFANRLQPRDIPPSNSDLSVVFIQSQTAVIITVAIYDHRRVGAYGLQEL